MKRLITLIAVLIIIGMAYAAPNYLLSISSDVAQSKFAGTSLRQAVQNLSADGMEIYYYNEHHIIGGSNKPVSGASELNYSSRWLYLVSKLGSETDAKITQAGNILLDLGTSLLLESNLDEIRLRELITNPFTVLELTPLQLSRSSTAEASIAQTRTDIQSIISHISADSVLYFIQSLQDFQTRYALADNRLAVANWIKNQFIRFGVDEANLYNFQWQGTTQYNVVATIIGSVSPDTYIIVGGHHDSITNTNPLTFAPGADDNASGTVAALEMARVMMLAGYQPRCSIRFVTFAAEEFGLWGSKAYALFAQQSGMDIRLMMNHDMISNTSPNNNDLRVLLMPYDGYMEYTDYTSGITTQYTDLIPVYGSMNLSASDSYSFWQRGFPVVYYFEYNFSQVYHSNNDITANINPQYCAKVITASTATAASFADMPTPPTNLEVWDQGTGSSLLVNWTAAADPIINGYRVYYQAEGSAYPQSQTTTFNSIVLNGLQQGVPYQISVCSKDDNDVESTRITGAGTPNSIPLTPTAFIDTPGLGSVSLTWNANTELDLASYRLFRSLEPTELGTLIATIPSTNTAYTDTDVFGTLAYFHYSLCAVDTQGNQSSFTELNSRPVTLDQGILVVDETLNYSGANPFQPTDEMVDGFYDEVMENLTIANHLDLENTQSSLRMADIGIYSSILWHGNDSAELTYPLMIKDVLRQYVNLGGNVLFSVYRPSQAFETAPQSYPATFAPNSFISEVLGISGANYTNDARFKYAIPAMAPYPQIQVDSLKTTTAFNGHIIRVEGLELATPTNAIYTYGSSYANGTTQGVLNGMVVGALNSYGQGKAVTLAFPLYHMELPSSRAMVTHVFGNIFNEPVSAEDSTVPAITGIELMPGYPNPFSQSCHIPIKTNDLRSPLTVEIYNLKGQLVRTVFNGVPATEKVLTWDGRDSNNARTASGIYYAKAVQNGRISTRKILLIK